MSFLVSLKKYASLIAGFFLASIPVVAYFFGKREGNKRAEKAEAKTKAIQKQRHQDMQNEVEYRQDIQKDTKEAEQALENENRQDSPNSFAKPDWD